MRRLILLTIALIALAGCGADPRGVGLHLKPHDENGGPYMGLAKNDFSSKFWIKIETRDYRGEWEDPGPDATGRAIGYSSDGEWIRCGFNHEEGLCMESNGRAHTLYIIN